MTKRLYLQNAAPGYTPTTPHGAWDATAGAAVVKKLGEIKSGTYADASIGTNGSNPANYDTRAFFLVSDPIPGDGTLAGTLAYCFMTRDNNSADAHAHIHVWVSVGDSDTVRGTLLTDHIGSEDWALNTAKIARGETGIALTPVDVVEGDRVIIELGIRDENTTVFHFPTVLIGYGAEGDDLEAGDTDTSKAGWFQFSDTNGVFVPPPPEPPEAGTAIVATGPTDWTVYVRDNTTLQRLEQVEDYRSLEMVLRFNDVGTWTMQLDRRSNSAVRLSDPAYGIHVLRGATTVMSGPALSVQHKRDRTTSLLTVSGKDDNVHLAHRLAMPEPDSGFPPYALSEYDVRTGVCSTILGEYVDWNAGPSAIIPRRVAGLVLADDPVVGTTVTGRARFQNLLELLQELATVAGLGFRVIQNSGQLEFQVYQPYNKTETVKFSTELGNLAGYDYKRDAPQVTFVVCAGGGEGTARTIREGGNSAETITWGRIEQLRDRRDTSDTDELDQTIGEELAKGGETTSLSISPLDSPTQRYLDHYDLGDQVSVVVDGVTIQEIVREVKISLSESSQRVEPELGTAGKTSVLALFSKFRELQRQVKNLERR